jgi:hypothetical protein
MTTIERAAGGRSVGGAMAGGGDLQGRLERVEGLIKETEDQLRQRRARTGLLGTEPEDRLLEAVRGLTAVVRDLASQGGQATATPPAAPATPAPAEASDSPRRQARALRRREHG